MRPKDITLFERLYLGSLALGIIHTAVTRDGTLFEGAGTLIVVAIVGGGFGLSLLLALLASRRRSNIARWIIVIFFAISLPFAVVEFFAAGFAFPGIAILVQWGISTAAIYFLFTPPALAWFRGEDRPASEIFS
ncbi:MAG: hypothetical protein ACK4K7_00425 [Allosphingosinicella sp.]|uniref:hypothetical protein n=1 Tax=Allosphingosinicella sp. TaxID=2823234 RepID=UPI0039233A1C